MIIDIGPNIVEVLKWAAGGFALIFLWWVVLR